MPVVELIEPSTVPPPMRQQYSKTQTDAMDFLRAASRSQKALILRLAPEERADAIRSNYQRAAKRLRLKVMIAGHETRGYRKITKEDGREPSVLYVTIMGRTPGVQAAAPTPPVVVTAPATQAVPSRGPLDGFRYDEPRKRGPKPRFTIPTPQPGYQALSHGIEVDR